MPGSKRVTIVSIAEKLGLSTTTVGFVLRGQARKVNLSEETVRRVREAAKEMGYVPNLLARGLRRQKTGMIGLLLADLSMNWAESLHQGLTSVLDQENYTLFIVMHRWHPARQAEELERLVRHQADAIICTPIAGCQETYQQYAGLGRPFTLVGDTLLGLEEVSVVGWDSERAAEKAVTHLVEQGCKNLACIGPRDETVMTLRRYEAFRRVVEQAGAHTREDWVDSWDTATWTPAVSDRWVARTFGDRERPEGIFAINDGTALPLMESLDRAGIRVPEDVALVGMGDLPMAGMPGIGLSTVREPLFEMGAEAARVTLRALKEESEEGPARVWLRDAELFARRTTSISR